MSVCFGVFVFLLLVVLVCVYIVIVVVVIVLFVFGLVFGVWMLVYVRLLVVLLVLVCWVDGEVGCVINDVLKLFIQVQVDLVSVVVCYCFLGDIGLQVVMGCLDWLFYCDGLCLLVGIGDVVFVQCMCLMQYWLQQFKVQGV